MPGLGNLTIICVDCGAQEAIDTYTTPEGLKLDLCDPCIQQRMRDDTDDPMGMEDLARGMMDES